MIGFAERSRSGGAPFRVLIGALLLAIGMAACGDGGVAGESRGGGQVVIAEGADMDKPNPIISESVLDGYISSMIYRPLLAPKWIDGELHYLTADQEPTALARRYEYFGPDSASIRYHLRSDVRWTDGVPVTAHDAAFSLRIQGLQVVASPRFDYNREFREIVAEDDSTLVVHFNHRYPEMIFHSAGEIIPRHVYEDAELSQLRSHPSVTDPVANLVTNGAMVITEWIRGQRVVLDPNPDFEPQAQVRVVFRIIPEETTRIIELQTGNVDITNVPFNYINQVRANDELRIQSQEKRSYEYVAYNPNAHEFFADPEIRRALSYAIDKDAMIAALELGEFATPAGGPYPPIFRLLYDAEGQASLPFDTAQARQILASKGWVPGADGVLRKAGVPFRFTLVTNGDNRRRVDIAQLLERQWARLGIDANIQTMEFNTVMERTQNREYQAMIGGWSVGLSADLYDSWSDPEQPFNFVNYSNPEVTRLFELALQQPTEEQAARYWQEGASILVSEQPYTWLFYYDRPFAVHNRVEGVRTDTLSPYQEVWNWRIVS